MSKSKPSMSSDDALQTLLAGNARYRSGQATHPHQTQRERDEQEGAQHPFAAILCCSDSRVPPGLIFDQGLGDLFVIRVAGNVVDEVTLASIEYAVLALAVPLVLVLGHSGCGAITAALAQHTLPGHLPRLVRYFAAPILVARNQPGDLLTNAINANVRLGAEQLHNESVVIRQAVMTGHLRIVPAIYDLHTGAVALLP